MKSTEEEEKEEEVEEETRGMKSPRAGAALCEEPMRSRRRSNKRSQRANCAGANRCDAAGAE